MTLRIGAILAATDLSQAGQAAIAAASGLARLTGARLHVVHALEYDGTGATSPDLEEAREAVRAQLRDLPAGRPEDVGVHVAPGPPHETILQWAEEVGADLLVIGPHRGQRGAGDPLGTVADKLVRTSHIPCLIVRGPLSLPLRRIVVPSDLSDAAQGALDVAFIWGAALRLPRSSGETTELDVVHGIPTGSEGAGSGEDPGAERTLRDQLAMSGDRTGAAGAMTVSTVILRDAETARSLLRFADERDADLLVLGTHGQSARDRSEVGSVSSAIARDATRPVLLVPPGYWKGWQERNALLEGRR